MPIPILYLPARYAAPPAPRKVRVTTSRKADGTFLTTLPAEDLDYLVASEYQRQRQLEDIAAHNSEDAAEIARHSLFIEGNGSVRTSRISRKPKLQPKHRKAKS